MFHAEHFGESDRFAADRLDAEQRAWLAEFPATQVVAGDVMLCHGTPSGDLDYFLETVNETGCRAATLAEVETRAEDFSGSLLLCGHTHLPRCVELADGRLVVNPGSVGLQAYDAIWPHPHRIETGSPHARYAMAERNGAGWRVEFVQVAYDWETQAQLAERNGRPEWARALRTGLV